METTKRCPIGLTGFSHFCSDDPRQHESLEKIQTRLERRSDLYEGNDLPAHLRQEKELLQFIRIGERPKRIETKPEMVTQTPKVEPAPVPAISFAQQEAMNAIAQLRAGVPFNLNRGYSQAEIREPESPKVMTFEEEIIHDWQTNPSIRVEFTSLNSYTAYRKAEREGKTKIHRGIGGL